MANKISRYPQFDERNLSMCKFLNLRGSHRSSINLSLYLCLLYIDISNSSIRKINFTKCANLLKIVIDAK